MEKISFSDLKSHLNYIFCSRDVSTLYLTDDNRIFKKFNSDYLVDSLNDGYNFESKVLEYSYLIDVNNIIVPDCVVYDSDTFIGYTMPYFNGVSIYDLVYCNNGFFSLKNLTGFFVNLENIVRNSKNIVFPDILTDGNILVSNTDIALIDYDGLQICDSLTPDFSTALGDKVNYIDTKYMNDCAYTKEMDIKSLIYLYFSLVFDYDLSELDECCSDIRIRVQNIFDMLGIDNYSLYDKVCRLYNNDVNNIYLGDTIFELADKYEIDVSSYDCTKRFVRK